MSATETLLAALLPLAVPLRIEALRHLPPARIEERRVAALDLLAHAGDGLLYRTPETRQAFVALVDALAILAFAPGGVAFAGWIWCADHGQIGDSRERMGICPQCLAEGR